MSWLVAVAAAVALGYQITAILATLRHRRRRDPEARGRPPAVSILKPVRGLDPAFREAIRSHAQQDYPQFEILFGVADLKDAAVEEIRGLAREFPQVAIRLIECKTAAPNGKVGVLADLAAAARFDVLLVNDSDIHVPAGYLHRVTAPLEDPGVGLVTCLYRASAGALPGIWEALGIATDFAPSTLVAPFVGVNEFGLGSTLVFRKADLERIGGFAAIAEYIADDYQLAKRITGLGLRVHLSQVVVETALQGDTWSGVWSHQLRWHRTIRVSRGAYFGLPVTHASLWAVVAAGTGEFAWAGALLAARMTMALAAGWGVLRSPLAVKYAALIPFRDLWGTAVWAAGAFGDTVRWRDRAMRLSPDGRIVESR